ncbi:MAG: hypothetical protein WAM62_03185 [Pseudolabrys sp.]
MGAALRNSICLALAALIAVVSAYGAIAQNSGSNQSGGAIFGAIIGGVIGGSIGGSAGSRIVGGIAGAAIGGLIGSSIGSYLDDQERRQLASMTRSTASTGRARHYRGKSGSISTRMSSESGSCRTVEQEVVMADGTKRNDSVQACRTEHGWKFG